MPHTTFQYRRKQYLKEKKYRQDIENKKDVHLVRNRICLCADDMATFHCLAILVGAFVMVSCIDQKPPPMPKYTYLTNQKYLLECEHEWTSV